MKSNLRTALAVALCLCVASVSSAATLYWEGRSVESAGVFLNSWDVGVTANWNNGGEAAALTTFANGDSVIFKDDGGGNNDNPTVVIDAGGVSPASVTFNRGFGFTYNISGGDILTGSMNGIRDDTKNFNRNGSYSFPGGTFITAGGSNFNYAPTSAGTYNFGTGAISVSNGSFNFNPAAAATLTNNFTLSGGSITGNANATFSGILTITGNLVNAPQNSLFVFPSLTLSQNTTINVDRCCSVAPAVQFNSNINGLGIHSITLASGSGNADWTSRVGAPAGSWNVKDITKTNRGRLQMDANVPDSFFTGLKANGGTFYHRGGMIQFRTAAEANITTFDLDFPFIFDPAAAVTGPGATQTGAGFNNLTTLNIIAGGVLGGNGTVAADNNLDGFNPTFESNVNVVVNNGGQLSPGLSVGSGTLNIRGNLTLNAGSQITMSVTGGGAVAGTDYDRLGVVGTITGLSNADLVVTFAPGLSFNDINGDVLTLITTTTNLTGTAFDSVSYVNAPFFWATVNYGNGFVTLSNFNAVPEPSTAMLVGLGAVGLIVKNRRRRQAAGK